MLEQRTIKDIEINLGSQCNNRCIFCMSDKQQLDSKKRLDLNAIRMELVKYKGKGFNALGFLGGEPTIHEDIISIVACAKQSGFDLIHVVSNGRRFADQEFLKALLQAGANRFSVSIHSHLEDVEDLLTQVKGGWRQKIQGIRNILALERQKLLTNQLSLNVVINKYNLRSLPQLLKFFKNMGCRDFRFNFIRPDGLAWKNFDMLVPTYREFKPYFIELIKFSQRNKVTIVFEGVPFCIVQDVPNAADYIGELKDYVNLVVKLNDENKVGDELETFSWKYRRMNECKVKFPGCGQCDFNKLCEGVWKEYVEKLGSKEFQPVKKAEEK